MIYNPQGFEDLDWGCPYCGKGVRSVMLDSTNKFDAVNPDNTIMGIERKYERDDEPVFVAYIVAEYPRESCKRKMFATIRWEGGQRKIIEAYPYPTVRPDSFPDSIPPKIREDFAEASRCYHVNAYKAVVAMCGA